MVRPLSPPACHGVRVWRPAAMGGPCWTTTCLLDLMTIWWQLEVVKLRKQTMEDVLVPIVSCHILVVCNFSHVSTASHVVQYPVDTGCHPDVGLFTPKQWLRDHTTAVSCARFSGPTLGGMGGKRVKIWHRKLGLMWLKQCHKPSPKSPFL